MSEKREEGKSGKMRRKGKAGKEVAGKEVGREARRVGSMGRKSGGGEWEKGYGRKMKRAEKRGRERMQGWTGRGCRGGQGGTKRGREIYI